VPPRIHIVGAGISGLAAAVGLAVRGRLVTLYEAAGHAGGRCRSFQDDRLERRIDNGNHLLLSGNREAIAFLATIGAADQLAGPERAMFPFFDVASGERWTVRPNRGRLPWWLFVPGRRVPGSRAADYLRGIRLGLASPAATVAECLDDGGDTFRRFWEPLAVAALNTSAREGAARLLWPVLKETFGRGEAACRPRIAARGLSECFVDPALALLRRQGAEIRFRSRVVELGQASGRITRLSVAGGDPATIGGADSVILAVPPANARDLVPGLTTPEASRAIVNGHFRLAESRSGVTMIGLTSGLSHWLFVRGDVASVTVSAADDLAEFPGERIAARLWPEVARALALPATPLPAWRILKEKRATFAQTPTELRRRPPCRTPLANLLIAGDWTDTGLPATIEGSVRSGNTAAAVVLQALSGS
jgi:squalene-associated FAD-dependent desaturase